MAAQGLHISISAEPVMHFGGLEITNSMLTSLVVSILLIIFAIIVNLGLKKTSKPKGIQNFAEWLVETFLNFTHSVTGNQEKARLFLPLVASFFLWIILNNWLGLFPGVGPIRVHDLDKAEVEVVENSSKHQLAPVAYAQERASLDSLDSTESPDSLDSYANPIADPTTLEEELGANSDEPGATDAHQKNWVPLFRPGTADLNTTLALAFVSIIATQFFGLQALGLSYFKKFVNFKNPIMFFVGILELVSEFAKIISFAFRLFGNIFAGEVLLAVIAFLIPVIVPMPFYGLELFVGFIQALVFAMLSLVFFLMATQSHEEH